MSEHTPERLTDEEWWTALTECRFPAGAEQRRAEERLRADRAAILAELEQAKRRYDNCYEELRIASAAGARAAANESRVLAINADLLTALENLVEDVTFATLAVARVAIAKAKGEA